MVAMGYELELCYIMHTQDAWHLLPSSLWHKTLELQCNKCHTSHARDITITHIACTALQFM